MRSFYLIYKEQAQSVQLGRMEKGQIKRHPEQELILSAHKAVSIMALVAEDTRRVRSHHPLSTFLYHYSPARIAPSLDLNVSFIKKAIYFLMWMAFRYNILIYMRKMQMLTCS